MYNFSRRSMFNLQECHPDLQRLFLEVIKKVDCTILDGYRGKQEQNEAYRTGNSGKMFPGSKHNIFPSHAVDVAPYPIDWQDIGRFYIFIGYVMCTAADLGIQIRHGGDWDRDGQTNDQSLRDLVHFELIT